MRYIISISGLIGDGYYNKKHPWKVVSKNEASVFDTMKEARQMLNKLNGRLLKDCICEIEKL